MHCGIVTDDLKKDSSCAKLYLEKFDGVPFSTASPKWFDFGFNGPNFRRSGHPFSNLDPSLTRLRNNVTANAVRK